jgi:predicted transcriptional regulator
MIQRRARQAGLPHTICCHTFRATGITTDLHNGGTIEHARQIVRSTNRKPRVAAGESPPATRLCDRTNDAIRAEAIIYERLLCR